MSSHSIRKRLKPEEWDLIQQYRGIIDASKENNLSPQDVHSGWLKSKNASLYFKNPHYSQTDFEQLKDQLITELQEYSPTFEKLERKQAKDSHLLVISPADIHIGKLALASETSEVYNHEIAVKLALQCIEGLIQKVSGYNIDKVLLIGGNDIVHVDTPHNTTTSGTKQDVSTMWFEQFQLAKQLYISIIEMLMPIADIHFIHCPSNHDYATGYFIADVVKTYFKQSENITFDTSVSHRKYFRYHNNLIGATHGDGAKESDLPNLMSCESDYWSECKRRYIYTHHIHHKKSKDYPGVTVESMRSISASDSWHHRNGYQHAVRAIECFLHDKEYGQVARFSEVVK